MTAPELPAAAALVSDRDWHDIFALLDTALDLDQAAQAAWMSGLGADHARLLPMLKELLQVHAAGPTDAFMPLPAQFNWPEPSQAAAELAPLLLVGPYRLIREIGQGGMASVWLAERADGLLERRVALKLPHQSWGAARFADGMARERNILASLTHPNIARLYDAGIAVDGRPFLALEHVVGLPIDAYARARQLGLRERVGLVVQVARAVAHAHARLVVHRDLKPSNILVDEQGQAHLLDFGIAKLIDPQFAAAARGSHDAPLTQAPARALTPDYASPEQIRGEAIGTASDIYSLGVVLFELLVGERPYRLKKDLSAVALALAIEQTETPRASDAAADPALRRALKGDLDAILARTLAKAGGERYATVDALADDLERHLRGEPVLARPDSRWYRSERWLRRHKLETAVGVAIVVAVPAGAAAQAAVLVAIAAGAGVALWQARVARGQAVIARAEAARAAAVKSLLTSFFKSGSVADDAGAFLGRLTVREFVERGARKIDLGFDQQPALRNEMLDVLSMLFADLADGQLTLAYAHKWQASLQRFGASEAERARADQRVAQGLGLLSRSKEAEGVLTAAIARLRSHPDPSLASLLAQLLVARAEVLIELGDRPAALASVDEALEHLASLPPSDSGGAAVRGAALFQRAELISLGNRLLEARPLFDEALKTLGQVHGERSQSMGRHHLTFASHLANGHQIAAAEHEFRRAIDIFEAGDGEGDLSAAIVKIYLGRMLAIAVGRAGARAEGLRLLGQAQEVFDSRVGAVSPHYAAQVKLYLAEALIEDGELATATVLMQACLAFYGDGVDNPLQRSNVRLINARLLLACGEYEPAIRGFEEARLERVAAHGSQHPLTVALTCRIGQVQTLCGDFLQARLLFESILQFEDNDDSVWVSVKQLTRMCLAVTQLEEGQAAPALQALQQVFDTFHAHPEKGRYLLNEAELSLNLGRAHLLGGDAQSALPLFQRSVDSLQANHPRSLALASNRCWLGLCCVALGDAARARALAEQARQTLDAEPSAGPHYRRSLALLTARLAEPVQPG